MKRIALAAFAAFALVCPADAQQMSVSFTNVPANTGTLTSSADTVVLPIGGGQWATVRFSVVSGGTAVAVAEVSLDGGTNFATAAYAKRLSTVSANPSVALISGTLTTADIWEIPLPSNATHFQLRCTSGGTSTKVNVYGGLVYVPGSPVVAILSDVTSGTNAALDTGTVDVSGWGAVYHFFTMNGGTPAFSIQEVDDAGVTQANLITSATAFVGGIGNQYGSTTIGGTAGLAAATASLPLPRRLRYQSGAIVAQTSRIRLEARR